MGRAGAVSPGLVAQEGPAALVVGAVAADRELVQSPEGVAAAGEAAKVMRVLGLGLDVQPQQHLGAAILTGKTAPTIHYFCLADRWPFVFLARAKCRVLGPEPVHGLAGPVPSPRVSRQVPSPRPGVVEPW